MMVSDRGWRRTLFAIIGLMMVVACACAEDPIPGTGALAYTIVTDLPWAFSLTSEAFGEMATRLKAAVGRADEIATPILFCRCGGGCTEGNGEQ